MSVIAVLFGGFLVILALVYVYLKIEIAYDHCSGGAPLLDGYIFPPIIFGIGSGILFRQFQIAISPWVLSGVAFVFLLGVYQLAWWRGSRRERLAPAPPKVPAASSKGRTALRPKEAQASWDRIAGHTRGALIAVRFAGTYTGSFSREMREFLHTAIEEANAAAVIIDLTMLDFHSGEDLAGLGELVMPLVQAEGEFRPAAVVAKEQSAEELKWLFEPNIILGVAGIKLFLNRDEALAHVRNALG